MAAKSTKGVQICLTGDTAATPAKTITAIAAGTAANSVDVSATGTFVVGDLVKFGDVGYASLNNKSFPVTALSTGGFEISNVTLGAGTLSASPKVEHFEAADLTCLCLSSVGIQADSGSSINVGTFCEPTATIPGAAGGAGTLSFAGFVDVTAKDYPALLAAVEDGKERIIRITLPGNGYITAPLTIASITWDIPLDGAVGFSGTATLASKPKHNW
jgi:hypothetical protein